MAGRTISFFEHQFRAYVDLGISPNDPILEALERLNASAGREIFGLERTGLRAGEQVGVVQVGAYTFEILPKIDAAALTNEGEGADRQQKESAAQNLLALLSYAFDLPLLAQSLAGLSAQAGPWTELLTRLFAVQLRQELLSGVSHSYLPREEALPFLRGRWDLARQSVRGAGQHMAFEVNYDDFTADIPLNQVFRFAVERLSALTLDAGNQMLLSTLRDWLQPVMLLPEITSAHLERITFNRLTNRFQPAYNLARLFLAGSVIQLRAGLQPAYAFVFDMNLLFERFVAGFLVLYRQRIFPDPWQAGGLRDQVYLLAQSAGGSFYLAESDGQGVLRLIPDLLFKRRGSRIPLLVADTKYKLLADRQSRLGIASEDAYQMLAYLVRLGCSRGLLLYPQAAGSAPLRRRLTLSAPGVEITACSLNLRQPLIQPTSLIEELREILRFSA